MAHLPRPHLVMAPPGVVMPRMVHHHPGVLQPPRMLMSHPGMVPRQISPPLLQGGPPPPPKLTPSPGGPPLPQQAPAVPQGLLLPIGTSFAPPLQPPPVLPPPSGFPSLPQPLSLSGGLTPMQVPLSQPLQTIVRRKKKDDGLIMYA